MLQITACDNMRACAFRYHLYVLRSPDACLLAWHLEEAVACADVS